jgi:peptidoglycan/LPS O-acetylase OafA/YrhL
MTWFVVAQPGWPRPTGGSALVNGLLLQDVVTVPSPNRAFWSIAIEAQLYVALPLLLLLCRRVTAAATVALVACVVIAAGALGGVNGSVGSLVTQLTPDLAVLFAVGTLAAGIHASRQRDQSWPSRLPWHLLALGLVLPVLVMVGARGSVWTIDHLFWVDLALGPAVGCLLVAVASGRPAPFVGVLDSRPLRSLGSFSYSLYLTHAPIVIAMYYGLVRGRVPLGVPTFVVLVAVVVPVTIVFARVFAAMFELPFQRHRGWAALRPPRWRTTTSGSVEPSLSTPVADAQPA